MFTRFYCYRKVIVNPVMILKLLASSAIQAAEYMKNASLAVQSIQIITSSTLLSVFINDVRQQNVNIES